MTDLKFNILNILYNSYPLRELTRMNIFNSIPDDKVLIHNALKELQSLHYIQILNCSDVFKLTDLGAEIYENTYEFRKENSKRKRENMINRVLTIFTLSVSCCQLIFEVFSWLCKLF